MTPNDIAEKIGTMNVLDLDDLRATLNERWGISSLIAPPPLSAASDADDGGKAAGDAT